MRKAAGVLLIVGGIACVYPLGIMVFGLVQRPLPVVFFVAVGFVVGGGVSAIRKRAYWWAVTAAICLMALGTIFGFWEWEAMLIQARRLDVATRVLYTAIAVLFGVPGLPALIFLVKRKGEFGAPRAG